MSNFNAYDAAQAAQKIMDEIKENYSSLTTLNVVVIGKTGVGKSTLINSVFGENVAEVGLGRPVTQSIRKLEKEGTPLAIYDTPGLELQGDHSAENLLEQVTNLINEGIQSEDVNQAIHCIWYCINTASSRVEPTEMNFLRKLGENTKRCNVPVILVLTQAFSKKKTEEMVTALRKENLPVRQVVPVLAQDYEISEDYPKIKAFGIDKLVELMSELLPDTVRDTFIALQIASIDLKRKRARAAVTAAAGAAALTGASPIPFSDAAILVPTQVSMLAGITAIFGLPIEKAALTSIVSATIGTAGATVLGKTVVSNLIKMIPGAGTIVGAAISGTTAAALTGALGEAYIAILTRVASGDISFADLTSKEGMEELRREFEKQLRISHS
ncbi:MAG: 50S ribosome-binding GTPase [Faecalibacterium sp.]|nr:50S ribosome-binding GTPase [Faecalibacterium sp.]